MFYYSHCTLSFNSAFTYVLYCTWNMIQSHLQLELDHVIPPEPMFPLMSNLASFLGTFLFFISKSLLFPQRLKEHNLMDCIYWSVCCTIIVSSILLLLSTKEKKKSIFFPLQFKQMKVAIQNTEPEESLRMISDSGTLNNWSSNIQERSMWRYWVM